MKSKIELKMNTVTDEATAAITALWFSDVDTLPTVKESIAYIYNLLPEVASFPGSQGRTHREPGNEAIPEGAVIHVWLSGLGIQDPLL